jgi:hypothetical protein
VAGVIGILTPYARRGAKWLIDKVREKIEEPTGGEIAGDKARIILETLEKKWKEDKTASDTLSLFKEGPDVNKNSMKRILEEKLADDKDLAMELSKHLNEIGDANLRIIQQIGEVDASTVVEIEEFEGAKAEIKLDIDTMKRGSVGVKIGKIGPSKEGKETNEEEEEEN